jgi:5-(aminomethyl)-3-furanmethanol phosphate kinase
MRRDLTVVKLGGSHAFAAHLTDWIDAIAICAERVVVVPGGGPFADAVRAAQPRMGFDDGAAHRMALLAMEQYGCALASRSQCLSLADTLAAIDHALNAKQVPVWLPTRMVLAATEIPWSWDVTSDSLAAWLAGKIGASRLLLVKHIDTTALSVPARNLVTRGIIDQAFLRFLKTSGVPAFVLGPADHAAMAEAIRGGRSVGAPIDAC